MLVFLCFGQSSGNGSWWNFPSRNDWGIKVTVLPGAPWGEVRRVSCVAWGGLSWWAGLMEACVLSRYKESIKKSVCLAFAFTFIDFLSLILSCLLLLHLYLFLLFFFSFIFLFSYLYQTHIRVKSFSSHSYLSYMHRVTRPCNTRLLKARRHLFLVTT